MSEELPGMWEEADFRGGEDWPDPNCPFTPDGVCIGGCPSNAERACINGEPMGGT